MSRPIDDLIDLVRSAQPSVEVEQLHVSHTADDDNVWFFRLPGDPDDVQVDTHPDGRPPFLVESSQSAERANVAEAADAARVVLTWLTRR